MWENLIEAIKAENAEEAIRLITEIDAGDLSKVDNDNRTALHLASILGQEEIVKLLINKEPNLIDLVDKEGKTALYHAQDRDRGAIINLIANNETLIKHTMSLIKQGQEAIHAQEIKDHIIMVLGPTGVGKGTLINYLNGTALTPIYDGGVWKLGAEGETLPGISISSSNSKSDTFHPAIYSPKGEGFSYSYVDTPGFGDSRGVAYDIATAYFRQEVTKNVNFIKTLLVLPYEDFVSTVSRGDRVNNQMHTLSQFLQFNKNITHITGLKDSIGLVVTQVASPKSSIDDLQQKQSEIEADIRELLPSQERIKNRMNEEIQQLSRDLKEVEETPFLRKATIRTAFDEQISTGGIEKDVSNHLTRDSNFEIFSRPIELSKEKAVIVPGEKGRILELIDRTHYVKKSDIEIGLPISADSKLVVTHLAEYVNNKILSKVQKSIPNIINDCNSEIVDAKNFNDLKDYLEFKLKTLDAIIKSTDCGAFLDHIKNNLSKAKKINEYVDYLNFFNRLNEAVQYEVVKWGSGLVSIKQQIEKLLEYKTDLPELPNGILKISGIFISANDVLNKVRVTKDVKEVKICALNTLFLDQDFQHNDLKGTNCTIIAPNWKIIGNRIIDLQGKDGPSHQHLKADDGIPHEEYAVNESYGTGLVGNPGKDGIPGNPGYSGGNFFGIGKHFDHLDCLTVNVSGGRGGKGQDGGNGGKGSNGNNGDLAGVQNRLTDFLVLPRKELGFADKEGASWAIHGVKKLATFNSQFLETYTSRGADGGKGGDAGKGGAGGIGGLPGNVKMIDFEQHLEGGKQHFSCIVKKGATGQNGSHGHAGIGGSNGITYTGQYVSEEVFPALRGRGETSAGAGIAGTASTTAVVQLGVVTPAQIAAQEAAKEVVKKATEQAIKEAMQQTLNQMAQTGVSSTISITTKTILEQVGKEVGKEIMQAAGKEAAKEIGLEATKVVLAEAAVGQAVVNGVKWTWIQEACKQTAKNVGTEITKDVAVEAAKGSWLTTIGGVATSMGTSLGVQALFSIGSSFLSSDWIDHPHDTGRPPKAKDGKAPTEKNTVGRESPKKSSISDQTDYKMECEKYYNECSAPDFVDHNFIELCSSLIGEGTGIQVDYVDHM